MINVIAIKHGDNRLIEQNNVSRTAFDGHRLEALQVNCLMTNQEDVKKLIEFLEIHKHCFDLHARAENRRATLDHEVISVLKSVAAGQVGELKGEFIARIRKKAQEVLRTLPYGIV